MVSSDHLLLLMHELMQHQHHVRTATSSLLCLLYSINNTFLVVYEVTLLLSTMTYKFQSLSGKTDFIDLWVIKPTNQVSPSSGFRVPLYPTICAGSKPIKIKSNIQQNTVSIYIYSIIPFIQSKN